MLGAVEPLDAFDADHVGTRAAHLCAHRVQHPRQVLDFRLARRVFDYRRAARPYRGHHDVLGRADRWIVEPKARPGQTFGMRLDISMAKLDAGTERANARDM